MIMQRAGWSCVAAAILIAAAESPAAAKVAGRSDDKCFADWSDAARIVAQERLVGIAEVGRLARQLQAVDLVRTTLCTEQGRYVYRVVVRVGHGGLRSLTVDARRPFDTR